MLRPKNYPNISNFWFWGAIVGIFVISLVLRFWGLSRFNTLVFDEIYYAKFANNYLSQTPFFNVHPPLSQYIIAIGIWIGSHLPFGQDTVNDLAGSTLSTWSYRWLNALTGSFIPLLVGAIAYNLTHRRSYTLIATLLIATDGLLLVESRYALNNIYLVLFGLLAQLLFIISLQAEGVKRWIGLIFSGICFGATVAVKWNGLGFLLGIYLLLAIAWIIKWKGTQPSTLSSNVQFQSPLKNITQLSGIQLGLSLAIIPLIIYSLAWIPHLQLNPEPGLWKIQTTILQYHRNLGSGQDVHPYCAPWYTWLLMIRPLAYFFERVETPLNPDPSLPPLTKTPVIYDVHAMGNPPLWWFSVLAILLTFGVFLQRMLTYVKVKRNSVTSKSSEQIASVSFSTSTELWLLLYLILNWSANWLPWIKVTRCVFLYHYISSLVFAVLIVTSWIESLLYSQKRSNRVIGVTGLFLILMGFIFWMPIYLGLPLSPEEWKLRMWFSSWI